MNNLRNLGLSKNLNRTRKIPTPPFGFARIWRHRNGNGSRPPHHRTTTEVVVHFFNLLAGPKDGPKRRRFGLGRGVSELGVGPGSNEPGPGPEEGNRDGSGATESRFAFDEIGDSACGSGSGSSSDGVV